MLKSMWYSVAALIVLVTGLWFANSHKINSVGGIAGMTLFASVGYIIIIFLILFAVIYIIRWSIEKMSHNI
jgi:hypothetical protein